MTKPRLYLYPIYMNDVPPHYTLQRAFERHFDCFTFDWVNLAKANGLPETQRLFLQLLQSDKPEYTFMQLQNPDNMSVETIREMAQYTKIINWTGDVRHDTPWYDWLVAIGKEIYLTLICNREQPQILRDMGIRADYLQVGYDSGWYYDEDKYVISLVHKETPEIVYCANNNNHYPLAKLRQDAVMALTEQFPDKFKVYGSGWESLGIKTVFVDNKTEATLYRNAKIALSISNYSINSYWSDRQPRIMACGGAVALSHEFPGMYDHFLDGVQLYSFHDIPEMINICHAIMERRLEINSVSYHACKLALNEHTWDARCKELIGLLEKYR